MLLTNYFNGRMIIANALIDVYLMMIDLYKLKTIVII